MGSGWTQLVVCMCMHQGFVKGCCAPECVEHAGLQRDERAQSYAAAHLVK